MSIVKKNILRFYRVAYIYESSGQRSISGFSFTTRFNQQKLLTNLYDHVKKSLKEKGIKADQLVIEDVKEVDRFIYFMHRNND